VGHYALPTDECRLLYVVGKPLQPPHHLPGQPVEPSKVHDLHQQYYSSLVDLFERYKHLHPEFAQTSGCCLLMIDRPDDRG